MGRRRLQQTTERPLADRLRDLTAAGGDAHVVDLAAIERMIERAERKLDRPPEIPRELRAA